VGSVFGVRHSLKYLIGIIVGTAVVLVAVATGITAALLALPAIGSVLLGISAAYILWLAYHIATAPPPRSRPRPWTLRRSPAEHSSVSPKEGAVLRVVPPQRDRDLR
jgi:threonine/homoserine/homoserine lactone efflux protein